MPLYPEDLPRSVSHVVSTSPSPTLEDQIECARRSLATFEAQLAKLEEQKKERDEIKVGDWVVITKHPVNDPNLYKTLSRNEGGGEGNGGRKTCFMIDKPGPLSPNTSQYHIDFLRKATPAEIKAHLEANQFKIGDWVVNTFDDKNTVHRIAGGGFTTSIYILDPKPSVSGQVHVDNLRRATPKEIEDAQEIKVAGQGGTFYKAEFLHGHVAFGCARIDNRLIRQAHALTNQTEGTDGVHGNRRVDSVKIGAGEFTREILEKLVKRLVD